MACAPRPISILQAIDDPKLFGSAFRDRKTWSAWRTFLAALFALPMTAKQTAMAAAQATETQKQGDADAARDAANAAEWAFHNLILNAKDQVKAQFGADSDEWQALGMRKKSERKKPSARRVSDSTAKAAA